MKGFYLVVLFVMSNITMYAQIGERNIEAATKLETSFATLIDSTKQLTQGCVITYSSDSIFTCIHLTLENGEIIPLDVKLKSNGRGYVAFKEDHSGYILINERNTGSGNPLYITKVLKSDGSRVSVGEEPKDY